MSSKSLVVSAKVLSRGQVTIPKDVRSALGASPGDRVTFVVEGHTVRIVHSAVNAMQVLQAQMQGEAEKAGLSSEEDVLALVKEVRSESEV